MVKMPHWPIPHRNLPTDYSLSRIAQVLQLLGDPHKKLPPIVHIAGTNGKGSTVAYLKAIMQRSGYRVHSYISPHLVEFNERIELCGNRISDAHLYQLAEEVRVAVLNAGLENTFFEGTTAMAMLAFSRIQADVLLLEVGMGGTYDATNIIQQPALSIITPISYDHTEFLGSTLAEIATAKAGIIKANCPTVISWQPSEALEVLLDTCVEKKAPALAWGINWEFSRNFTNNNDNTVTFSREASEFLLSSAKKTNSGNISELLEFKDSHATITIGQPALLGVHQYVNAASATVAAIYLALCLPNFSSISADTIRWGIANAQWPARMQRITEGVLARLLPPGSELILDGAHNSGGAEMLRASLDEINPSNPLPLYIINGRTRNRNIVEFLQHFADICTLLLCVEVKSEPLAESADKIYAAAQEIGMPAQVADSVFEAVQICVAHAKNQPIRIVICGSLYLAGDVLKANSETPVKDGGGFVKSEIFPNS